MISSDLTDLLESEGRVPLLRRPSRRFDPAETFDPSEGAAEFEDEDDGAMLEALDDPAVREELAEDLVIARRFLEWGEELLAAWEQRQTA